MNFWQSFSVFFAIGLLVGGQVNHAVYRFTFFPRNIGPWIHPDAAAPARRWFDHLPVVGWIGLSRESSIHGANFWLRPLLIELCFGFAFAGLWSWEVNDAGMWPIAPRIVPPTLLRLYLILIPHLVLVALLAAATFIDFDDYTIPDQVTVPGTLFALGWFTAFPQAGLPILGLPLGPRPMAVPLQLSSPLDWPLWLDGRWGVAAGVGIFLGWCWALVPSTWTGRHGIIKRFQYLFASWLQPRRRRQPTQRRAGYRYWPNRISLVMALLGSLGIVLVWSLVGGQNWRGLLSSLVGLGFAGAVIWAIRIIAKLTLRQEGMGFGDVTLLAMIGAFMGWQSALPILFMAPFAGLVIGLIQWLLVREKRIAFGPYLCLAAIVLLLKWPKFWADHGERIFGMGLLVPQMVAVFLVLLLGSLYLWQFIKQNVLGIRPESNS